MYSESLVSSEKTEQNTSSGEDSNNSPPNSDNSTQDPSSPPTSTEDNTAPENVPSDQDVQPDNVLSDQKIQYDTSSNGQLDKDYSIFFVMRGQAQETISKIISQHKGFGFYKLSSGYYAIDVSGLSKGASTVSPVKLVNKDSAAYTFKVLPIALTKSESGSFSVFSKNGQKWKEQKFDENGNALGPSKTLTLSDLLLREVHFQSDINKDKFIGDKISQVFEVSSANGDHPGLYKTASGAYIIDTAGLKKGFRVDDPIIIKEGSSSGNNYSPKIKPYILLSYENGNHGLIFKDGKAWIEQKVDSNGIVLGSRIKLNPWDLMKKEDQFKKDINRDGMIGDSVIKVYDANGYVSENKKLGLYKTKTGSYVLDETGKGVKEKIDTNSVKITTGKKDWTPKEKIIGIAEKASGYIEVLMKKGNAFFAQKIDPENGHTMGSQSKIDLVKGQLDAREYYYNLDLNGDNQINQIGHLQPPTEWAL